MVFLLKLLNCGGAMLFSVFKSFFKVSEQCIPGFPSLSLVI